MYSIATYIGCERTWQNIFNSTRWGVWIDIQSTHYFLVYKMKCTQDPQHGAISKTPCLEWRLSSGSDMAKCFFWLIPERFASEERFAASLYTKAVRQGNTWNHMHYWNQHFLKRTSPLVQIDLLRLNLSQRKMLRYLVISIDTRVRKIK